MAEIKLEPQNVEEVYKKGPGTMPDISNVQIPESKDDQLNKIKAEIDDLRLFAEYNRYLAEQEINNMKYHEAMVMTGKMSINQIPDCPMKDELIVRIVEAAVKSGKMPITKKTETGDEIIAIAGLQGLMLRADELTSQRYLLQVKMEHMQMQQAQAEKEQKLAESDNQNQSQTKTTENGSI